MKKAKRLDEIYTICYFVYEVIVLLENWDNAIVTDISIALYVAPHTGKAVHNDRAFHGFVINDANTNKIIHFSDGTAIRSGPYEVHYLPKNSNYRVQSISSGGCWAINFNLLEEIEEKPFNIMFRNHESILKNFKDATSAWKNKKNISNAIVRKCIYDIIINIRKEHGRNYIPSAKELLIKPAIDTINSDFTKNDLSVKDLADICGISEAYFHRIFTEKFGISPKEYIINRRIEYAKKLLLSKQFSVGEIAEMCGYSEPCHFSREFSKRTGVSPNKYIKENLD